MKRIPTVVAVVAVVMLAASITYFAFTRPAPNQSDAPKIFAAAHAFAHNLQAQGAAVPSAVDLRDLVAKGLLRPSDVSGFAGMDVTVSLNVSEEDPQSVLMRVRMQHGSQIVALADGSVQGVSSLMMPNNVSTGCQPISAHFQ